MSGPPVKFTTSPDLKTWYNGGQVTDGTSNYGHQMAVYRGELYGILTGLDKQLYATKFKTDQGWKSFISLPSKFRAAGRVAVAVLEDRFYVSYRGTNDAVYLVYTSDFHNWTDAGRIGSTYAKTMAAPAMAAFDGNVILAGVGADKYIYTTSVNSDGKRLISWKKVDKTGTQSALNLEVHGGDLYLFHTGYNNDKIFYQTFTGRGWNDLQFTSADIKSGVSAVSWKHDEMFVAWRSADDNSMSYKTFDGKSWSKTGTVGRGLYMTYQIGACTWGGEIFVSFGERDSDASGYRFLSPMSEKRAVVHEEEVDAHHWDVKWKNSEAQKKGTIRKFFCM